MRISGSWDLGMLIPFKAREIVEISGDIPWILGLVYGYMKYDIFIFLVGTSNFFPEMAIDEMSIFKQIGWSYQKVSLASRLGFLNKSWSLDDYIAYHCMTCLDLGPWPKWPNLFQLGEGLHICIFPIHIMLYTYYVYIYVIYIYIQISIWIQTLSEKVRLIPETSSYPSGTSWTTAGSTGIDLRRIRGLSVIPRRWARRLSWQGILEVPWRTSWDDTDTGWEDCAFPEVVVW